MAGPFTIYLASFRTISTKKRWSGFHRPPMLSGIAKLLLPPDHAKSMIPIIRNLLSQLDFHDVEDAAHAPARPTMWAWQSPAGGKR
jgi:hypothetical protein